MNGVTDIAINASCKSICVMTNIIPPRVTIAVISGTKPSVDRDRRDVASFWMRYVESAVPFVSWYTVDRRCICRKSRTRISVVIRFPTRFVSQMFNRFCR